MLAARGSGLGALLLDCTGADVDTFVLAARGSGFESLVLGGDDGLGLAVLAFVS